MVKKKRTNVEVFVDCLKTVESSGVVPRQQPVRGAEISWGDLTQEEQKADLNHRHPLAEYAAFKKLVVSAVIDPILSALEDVYGDFPEPELTYAEANSIPADREGIHSIKGEKQYLNWLIAGLLSLTSEAVEKGHGRNAARFAFEAGILWSMSNHAKARRTLSTIQETLAEARRLAVKSRATKADQTAKLIRDEVDEILRGSPVPMTPKSARAALARKSHFKDGTPMLKLRTINAAFSPKHAPKNR